MTDHDRLTLTARSFPGRVWQLARPYWFSEEKWTARALLAVIIGMNLGLVYLNVLFNEWNRLFYNALQAKDYGEFSHQLLRFCVLAAIFIVVAVYQIYLNMMLQIRWRRWITNVYFDEWLSDRVYYRLEIKDYGTDNPDQRISQDLNTFAGSTLTLSLGLLSSVVTLASFVAILWTLSGTLAFSVLGHHVAVPGYMVWVALVYAAVGSWLTHKVGRPLIGINFNQERFEADFRFALVRLRENAEGVALYGGEPDERAGLVQRFGNVWRNWWQLMRYRKRLAWFTSAYGQVAIVFPILVAAPRYFAGAIKLGGLMQTASAFGQVQGALSWFVDAYSDLANWKASVDRLLTFHGALEQARAEAHSGRGIEVRPGTPDALAARDLELALPDGRVLVAGGNALIRRGERVLLHGPSGAGKSTLFRAMAGIWPFGHGVIERPSEGRVLFLPQKPYLPIGTLRAAVSYPANGARFDDAEIEAALADCRLESLGGRLDESQHWAQKLSPGEQQRIAVARALLHRPDWLFLDEATAALDEESERHLYDLICERLPGSTILSIAHRPGLARYHGRRIGIAPTGSGAALVLDPVT